MTTVELEREAAETQVDELERLWAAPAAHDAPRRRLVPPYAPLRTVLVGGWVAFVVGVIALEPVSNANAVVPLWAEVTVSAFWLALLIGGALAWLRLSTPALGASALAGGVGVVLGYACRATEHHLGSWWLLETGACAALALLSLGCLVARRSASTP